MISRSGIFLPAVCFLIRDDVLYRPSWSSDHFSPSNSLTEQIGPLPEIVDDALEAGRHLDDKGPSSFGST